MPKTLSYLLGSLSLHFTDFSHASSFYNLVLPIVDVIFLIFLCWQLIFFMALNNSFSDGDHYHLQDLVTDIYDLHYDIRDHGLLSALFSLALNIFEMMCFLLSIFYYYGMVIEMVRL